MSGVAKTWVLVLGKAIRSVLGSISGLRLRTRILSRWIFDRATHPRLRYSLLQAMPLWCAAAMTGLVAVFYAEAFAWAEKIQRAFFHRHPWGFLGLAPFCFLASWALVRFLSPGASGSGIPQVMAAMELARPKFHGQVERLLGLRVIVTKVFSSLLLVVGGGAIGREGPTIQIASSIFCLVQDWLPKNWRKPIWAIFEPRYSRPSSLLG